MRASGERAGRGRRDAAHAHRAVAPAARRAKTETAHASGNERAAAIAITAHPGIALPYCTAGCPALKRCSAAANISILPLQRAARGEEPAATTAVVAQSETTRAAACPAIRVNPGRLVLARYPYPVAPRWIASRPPDRVDTGQYFCGCIFTGGLSVAQNGQNGRIF